MSVARHPANGRVAVVTGAASGIGWAIGQRLARDGFGLVLVDKSASVADRARDVQQQGGRAAGIVADLADLSSLPMVAQSILDDAGRCDVLVNNAGTHIKHKDGSRFRLEEVTLREWDLSIALHMTAPLLLSQAFLPGMKDRRWGRVINISSRTARTFAMQSSAFYAASKAGNLSLTRTIAGEYAPHGITCNAIAPGRIETPLTGLDGAAFNDASLAGLPVGRVGQPWEIGAAASFLASDEAGFITGAVLDANGGAFMAP